MKQLSLDFSDCALARTTDPGTSVAAAISVSPERISKLQKKVLEGLRLLGGRGTMEEVCEVVGVVWQSLTPRFRPLANKGWIRESGTKKGKSGRDQIVWEINHGASHPR